MRTTTTLADRFRRRWGFTFLELLMVIGVIMVLVALLLPAVQQARESARRTSCQNNLRQLVLALNQYHDTHEVLPPGSTGTKSPVQHDPQEPHFSWTVRILPYVDMRPLFDQIDFENATVYMDGDWDADGQRDSYGEWQEWELEERAELRTEFAGSGLSVEEFAEKNEIPVDYLNEVIAATELKPQRPDNAVLYNEDARYSLEKFSCSSSYWGGDGNQSNYVALHHHEPKDIGDDDSGLLFLNSSVRLDDVEDGLAMTAVLSETVLPAPINWASGTRSTLRFVPSDMRSSNSLGRVSMSVVPMKQTEFLTAYELPEGAESYEEALDRYSLSSHHTGGFHVAMIDGQVGFYSVTRGSELLSEAVHRSDAAPLEGF